MINIDLDLNTESFVAVGKTNDVTLSHLTPNVNYPIIAYYEGTYNSLTWSKVID